MKKVISFCLWGNNSKYAFGAVQNALLAKYIYPGWETRFYVSDCVHPFYVKAIEDYGGVVVKSGEACSTSMFWRFQPLFESDVDVFISRDTDSRLNIREFMAVNQWLQEDAFIHVMHDHAYHATTPVLGGMWGAKVNLINDYYDDVIPYFKSHYEKTINEFKSNENVGIYNLDQTYLASMVHWYTKEIGLDVLSHIGVRYDRSISPWVNSFDNMQFPTKREKGEYVGAPYNELDVLEIPFIDSLPSNYHYKLK